MSTEITSEQASLKANPQAAFDERLGPLRDSIKILSIKKNLSGRNKFREKWPEIAVHLFGPELIRMDTEGTDDIEARAQKEDEAELNRITLKTILQEAESKSVDAGFLKVEYIGEVIDKIGSSLSLYIYAERIIERVRPGLLAKTKPTTQKAVIPEPEAKLTPEETNILRNTSDQSPPTQNPITPKKPLVPKGTLSVLFNWLAAQRS